mmetsp:Transcript_11468/g.18669  ORF Transcript_11468/g.18669 Transcript_11468/m.18669 type:complete len:209 (+) Transcript_11468:208-834(+)|eukprot:CAMPEP_0203793684 /NCGR_PEP_ID=MMETSP0100_2-20121128/6010_1 /ASSEMBLY_ACC=CAM_ASM_000210 /TAXON_ID=96639 /ORGANISM=" , Strain NY0313808BC1" /LENGTH=208 /DNA_ID=CAMNT_0050697507 /DNA_START=114 /DNA_END=740 /DNA_ORIENTATION=+
MRRVNQKRGKTLKKNYDLPWVDDGKSGLADEAGVAMDDVYSENDGEAFEFNPTVLSKIGGKKRPKKRQSIDLSNADENDLVPPKRPNKAEEKLKPTTTYKDFAGKKKTFFAGDMPPPGEAGSEDLPSKRKKSSIARRVSKGFGKVRDSFRNNKPPPPDTPQPIPEHAPPPPPDEYEMEVKDGDEPPPPPVDFDENTFQRKMSILKMTG